MDLMKEKLEKLGFEIFFKNLSYNPPIKDVEIIWNKNKFVTNVYLEINEYYPVLLKCIEKIKNQYPKKYLEVLENFYTNFDKNNFLNNYNYTGDWKNVLEKLDVKKCLPIIQKFEKCGFRVLLRTLIPNVQEVQIYWGEKFVIQRHLPGNELYPVFIQCIKELKKEYSLKYLEALKELTKN
jgi:hypothetical protein